MSHHAGHRLSVSVAKAKCAVNWQMCGEKERKPTDSDPQREEEREEESEGEREEGVGTNASARETKTHEKPPSRMKLSN